MFAPGDYQRIFQQYVDVVLDCPVFQIQLGRELVEVARTVLELVNDARPILAASRPSEKVPEKAAQFRIVRHRTPATQFGIYPLKWDRKLNRL